MADAEDKAAKELREITECPICMSAFTDPRILPCIHTFCVECLTRIGEAAQMKPGDKMPCPLCRSEFIIPAGGMNGVPKNFFMVNLLTYKATLGLQMGSGAIICDICDARNEGKTGQTPIATMRCLDCQDNYCESCLKVHQFQKLNKNHQVRKIGSDMIAGNRRGSSVKLCCKHIQKPLDYYCADCKKIVCVSCFVEGHKLHDCKDLNAVDEEFCQTIKEKAWKMSIYVDEMASMRKTVQKRQADFLKKIDEKEKAILKGNQDLKDMIDRDAKSLLLELSAIKTNHIKQVESQLEEIDRCCTSLTSFEAYCTELTLKGSASDVCSSVDGLILRADDLERDHVSFIGRPNQTIEVSFERTDLTEVLQKSNNLVGAIQGKSVTTAQFDNYAIIVGLDDGTTVTRDVVTIALNLNRSNEISTHDDQVPTAMTLPSVAAVYCNTMYVTGIGAKKDEIWRYKENRGWTQCTSLVQGRSRHCAAFIDAVLYVCGGLVESDQSVTDSVEAYNAVTDVCSTVGKLVLCVQSSGNCVPFKGSLYIFGGLDGDCNAFDCVQVYDTKSRSCTLLPTPMPYYCSLMGAVLWRTSVILVGCDTCFIFNLDTQVWEEREQFQTDVDYFGLVLENERVFVIGGGICKTGKYGEDVWKSRDDVRYVPLQNILENKPIEWKVHATLPKPTMLHAYEKLTFFVV